MSPACSDRFSTTRTSRPDRAGFRNSNPSVRALVVGRVHAHGFQLLDLLDLHLRLARLARLVTEPFDEPLETFDLFGLAHRGLRLVDRARGLLAPPHVPGAREIDGLAALELQHRSRHRFEEPPVVRDEDDGGVECLEQLLQPLERLDIEMVRRLVEQQQVGL